MVKAVTKFTSFFVFFFISVSQTLPLVCSDFYLSPSSQLRREKQKDKAKQLDLEIIRAEVADENFLEAAKYFNQEVMGSRLTWEKIIDLFEIFRGDRKTSAYTREVYKKRLHSVETIIPNQTDIDQAIELAKDKTKKGKELYQTFLGELVSKGKAIPEYPFSPRDRAHPFTDSVDLEVLANSHFNTREEVLQNAAKIYTFIIGMHIFFKTDRFGSSEATWTWETTRLPGFDNQAITKITGELPASGHHRLAWFVMNYFLMNNGYTPLYLKKGEGGANGPYGIVKPALGINRSGWDNSRLSLIRGLLEERIAYVGIPRERNKVRIAEGLIIRDGKLELDSIFKNLEFKIKDPSVWIKYISYAIFWDVEIGPILRSAMDQSSHILRHPISVTLSFEQRLEYMRELFLILEMDVNQVEEILSSFGIDLMQLIYDISIEPPHNPDQLDMLSLSVRHTDKVEKALGLIGLPDKNKKAAKILFIGGGKMSHMVYALLPKVVEALGAGTKIVGIVEPSEASREIFRKYVRSKLAWFYPLNISMPIFFDSLDEVMETGELSSENTIAYVVTPDETHAEMVKKLADVGINKIILEKPIAGNKEDIKKIVQLRDERKLNIIVNEQYLYSRTIGNIKAYLQSHGYDPVFVTMHWSKSRKADVARGRNIKTGSIFNYDIFHQVVIANSLVSNDSSIAAAWNKEMSLPGLKIPGHGQGVLLLRHHTKDSTGSILSMNHEKAMGAAGSARYINILAENRDTGKKIVFFVSIGNADNAYSCFDVIDQTDNQFKAIERYDEMEHPIVHAFYYYILGLLNDATLPSTLENIVRIHDLIDYAEIEKERSLKRRQTIQKSNIKANKNDIFFKVLLENTCDLLSQKYFNTSI